MAYYIVPDLAGTWFIPGGNTPATGGQLFTYLAGSSTKTTAYKDNLGNSAWTNPIVLDSGGNLPSGGQVWIPTGVTIDVVFAPANDTDPPASPYKTLQDLPGINDVNSQASEWVTGPAPTFVSDTSFVLQGDQSGTFKNGRRIRTTNTAGTVYGRITGAVFSASSTTVNTVSDAPGVLDSGLSATAYSLLDPQYTSIDEYHVFKDAGTVSSAGNGTTNIWGVAGNAVHIFGTNTIASFSTAAYAGATRNIIFDGALTLQTSAAFLSCPAGNLRTAAGDRAQLLASTAAHGVITQFQKASGQPLRSGPLSVQVVTSTGTHSVPVGATRAYVRLKGAGASGGGSATANGYGGGGGDGEDRFGWVSVVAGTTVTVTINAGGVAINAGSSSAGNAGGTTVWTDGTTTITAAGGSAGNGGDVGGQGGRGGYGGSGGDYALRGAEGAAGTVSDATKGINMSNLSIGGTASTGQGGGGGTTGAASGAGGTGLAVIEYWA